MNWQLYRFDELTVVQLHEILKLRQDIFVVEQTCPYPDIDGWDTKALHLLGVDPSAGRLHAYCRIFDPTVKRQESVIGRVVVSDSARGQGLGFGLMSEAISICQNRFGAQDIYISAQIHLEAFYSELGFKTCSEPYDEDGIDHIDMILSAVSKS